MRLSLPTGSWEAPPWRLASGTARISGAFFDASPRDDNDRPSPRLLIHRIAREFSAEDGSVIELGAGQGHHTRAILETGVHQTQLLLIDYGSDFARQLQFRFPLARVLWMDAASLSRYQPFKAPAAAVVSALPLASMSTGKLAAVLAGAFGHMRSGGTFYQITHGRRCPVLRSMLDRLGLQASRVGDGGTNGTVSTYRFRRLFR